MIRGIIAALAGSTILVSSFVAPTLYIIGQNTILAAGSLWFNHNHQ